MEFEALSPSGLICPLVTPLDKNENLDSGSFRRLWGHVQRWAAGIVIGDPLWGEGPFLSPSLRLALIEKAIEINEGRRPLLISITSQSLPETLFIREQAETIICRMNYRGPLYWVDYPLYYHGNRGLPQLYGHLLSNTTIPLILGNNAELVKMSKGPGRHKNIRTRVLKKIATLSAVMGIIYTGDLKRALNYHMAVRFREHFMFYDGDESVFIRNPAKGGVVAGGANLFPQQWSAVAQMSLDLPPPPPYLESARLDIWEDSRMLKRFNKLYRMSPAVALKKVLKQVGIISHDASVWPMTPQQKSGLEDTWQRDLEGLLATYDLI
jgi:4-hydroxy-tetrahydrodipicolinate synthase